MTTLAVFSSVFCRVHHEEAALITSSKQLTARATYGSRAHQHEAEKGRHYVIELTPPHLLQASIRHN